MVDHFQLKLQKVQHDWFEWLKSRSHEQYLVVLLNRKITLDQEANKLKTNFGYFLRSFGESYLKNLIVKKDHGRQSVVSTGMFPNLLIRTDQFCSVILDLREYSVGFK